MPRIPAAARLSGLLGSRASTRAKTSDASQRTAASAQPCIGQPAIAKIGSASAMIVPAGEGRADPARKWSGRREDAGAHAVWLRP